MSKPVHAIVTGFVVVPDDCGYPKRAPAREADCESFRTTLAEAQAYAAEWWGAGCRIHAARLTVLEPIDDAPAPPVAAKPAQPELFK